MNVPEMKTVTERLNVSSEIKKFKESFGRQLGITSKAMHRRLNRNLAEAGFRLNADHYIILRNLRHQDGMNQQQISEIIARDKTATKRLIDLLEEERLVRRVPWEADRRHNMIHLTAKGKRLCTRLIELADRTNREALADIDTKEIKVCTKVLMRVLQNVQID